MTVSPTARTAALVVAVTALAALSAQYLVSATLTDGAGATLWLLAGYFTVLTNSLVAVSYATITLRGRPLSAGWLAGLTLWIVIVGVVYHLVLARLWAPEGLAWWADQGLHTAVPLLALGFWLGFAPKHGLGPRHAGLWLAWPVAYTGYALIRGAFTARYPYPFIDVTVLGYGRVAINAVALSLAFFLGGLVLVAIARALTR